MSVSTTEIVINKTLVKRLLAFQHPDLSDLNISEPFYGWDNVTFRLGLDLAIRLPRRQVSASLILNEQRWLPYLKDSLSLDIPVPFRIGRAQDEYPWCWSIVPWIRGETADFAVPGKEQAETLATFFKALHIKAPEQAPYNSFRGVALSERVDSFGIRIANLRDKNIFMENKLMNLWYDAIAEAIDVEPTWIHGDLHPRNILVHEKQIRAIIDWGDIAQGDRATDLAAIWMLFPCPETRRIAIAACNRVSEATWTRARGWAILFAVMFLDDRFKGKSNMALIGQLTLKNLMEDLQP
jgi:aminoglycoside phosphotransferase (APT) family kinase protein